MTVYRMAWEGTGNNSQPAIVAMAQAFQADNTGLMLYVTMDISTVDAGTGVTFASEALAYSYGQTSGNAMATALLPYMSNVLAIACGNEMTGKDSVRAVSNSQGTSPSDFNNAKWPMFRGVLRGCAAGIRAAGAFKVASNATINAEFASLDMLWNGTQPDGTTGHPTFRWDITDVHSYHAWNDMLNMPYDGAGWAPHFSFPLYCQQAYGVPIIVSEMNGDANSQTDAQMRAWMDKVYYGLFKSRIELNIAAVLYYEMFDTDFAWGMLESGTNAPRVNRGQAVVNFIRMYPDDVDGSTFDPVRNAAMEVFAKYPGQFHIYYPKEQSYSESTCTNRIAVGAVAQFIQDLNGYPQLYCWQTTQGPVLQSDGSVAFTGSFSTVGGTGAPLTVSQDHAWIMGCKPTGSAKAMALWAPASNSASSAYSRAGSIAVTSSAITATWTSNTPADYRASYTNADAWSTARVLTSRKVGNSGTLRVNGAVKATVDVTAWTAATMNTGYIGKEYHDDPNLFTGNVWCAIACSGSIADADLLILERWVNSQTPTGVSF